MEKTEITETIQKAGKTLIKANVAVELSDACEGNDIFGKAFAEDLAGGRDRWSLTLEIVAGSFVAVL